MTAVVAENIRLLMVKRDMNAAELRRAAGLNQTGVYDILEGRSKSPKVDTVAKIAKALGVNAFDLFSPPGALEERKALLAVFDRLPQAERDRLLLTATAWADQPSSI